MSDKELAVRIYLSALESRVKMVSDPNYSGESFSFPTFSEMVDEIDKITRLLSDVHSS